MYYSVDFYGTERKLPICPVNESLQIAAFNMLGDNELTKVLAEEAYNRVKDLDFDIFLTAECKGIAFTQEISRLFYERKNQKFFVAARKGFKLYMKDPVSAAVNSITTNARQTLWLSKEEADKLTGKKVVVVDDVISTGNTVAAIYSLLEKVGAKPVAELCVFAEGDAAEREKIIYLKKLPLFDGDGKEI
jgi:adenine phosphoribosyltransferase